MLAQCDIGLRPVEVFLRDDLYDKNGLPFLAEVHFSIHIFAENISQAKPISHTARCISQICAANLYHCWLGIALCPTNEGWAVCVQKKVCHSYGRELRSPLAPSQRGLSALADWGSVLESEVHSLHHCVVPLPLGGRQGNGGIRRNGSRSETVRSGPPGPGRTLPSGPGPR